MFIMKHATSRFLRFFLVAALVAAMARFPHADEGRRPGGRRRLTSAVPSTFATGEAIMWTNSRSTVAVAERPRRRRWTADAAVELLQRHRVDLRPASTR